MIINFKEYLRLVEYSLSSDRAGGAMVTNQGTRTMPSPNPTTRPDGADEVPALALELPSVTRRAKVVGLDYKTGGITEIRLEDGSSVRMTTGQFKKIGGAPVTPHQSILTLVYQSNPADTTQNMSQIMKATSEAIPMVRQL